MTLGITGNPQKDGLWPALGTLLAWLAARQTDVCLDQALAVGLAERGEGTPTCQVADIAALAARVDVLLSFGGDGTLLRTAHRAAAGPPVRSHAPILGVNLGRLGFLTKVEVTELQDVLARILDAGVEVETRMALDVGTEGLDLGARGLSSWALNDVVIDKSGTTSMIQVQAEVDGRALNTYWADGLIVATPTGSTAYALSAGGPIAVPGAEVIILAPIAPHTLTARPIVLPSSCTLTLRVATRGHPYAFAVDGVSALVASEGVVVHVRRSEHTVPLVALPDRDYFSTIRDKLSWGIGGVF